ncbi:YkgB family protein [Streptomyces chiangmaiensis]
MRSTVSKGLQNTGFSTIRYGLALNLLTIGRLKFESYEVENIRPLVTASPIFSRLVTKLGEQKLARLFGITEMVIGSLIAARPFAPRASALGSLGAAGIFATTLSFLATTPEAWQERRGEPKLSLAGQFLVKDIVLLGASLLTAAESLQAGQRNHDGGEFQEPFHAKGRPGGSDELRG